MSEEIIKGIATNISEFNAKEIDELVNKALNLGISPKEIISKALLPALEEVGEKYERKEYFLSELLMAADIGKHIMELLEESLSSVHKMSKGKVTISTVQGDLHDIGKNLFAALLKASGFEVYDLGVDVPIEKLIEKIKEIKPDVVGLSALLTVAIPSFQKTVEAIKKEDSDIKVLAGGRAISDEIAKGVGAIRCEDAWEGVKKVTELLSGTKKGCF